MHNIDAKVFIDAAILGVELAVVGAIFNYIFKIDALAKIEYIQKYRYFMIGIILFIIGLFVYPKLMFELAIVFMAIQIMFLLDDYFNQIGAKQ